MSAQKRKRENVGPEPEEPPPKTNSAGREAKESDFICPICLELVIEPVVLPCKHQFCLACFKCHINETSLQCPLCRIRISVWARRKGKQGTYVDAERWKLIQTLFPEKCRRRINGEEDLETFQNACGRLHVIAEEGELKKEYEIEMKKIEDAEEDNMKKTSDFIKQLQEEEDLLRLQDRKQEEEDAEMARKLQAELNKNVVTPIQMDLRRSKVTRRQSATSPCSSQQSTKLMRWLASPKQLHESHRENIQSDWHYKGNCSQSDQEENDHRLALKLQQQLNRSTELK